MNRLRQKTTAIILGLLLGIGFAYAGLETVTHIQDLNSSWPLGSDLASTSDDHIRNIKSALKTDFPNFNGTYTSAALPVFAIPSDTNTGIYSVAADDLGISTGGTLRFDISTTGITSTIPHLNADGSQAAPAYSFSGDTNTGVYRITTDTAGMVAGGAIIARWYSGGFQVDSGQGFFQDGSVGAPGVSFAGDVNTGLYRIGADDMALSTGGTKRLEIGSAGAVTISTPTSGTALTINGVSGGTAISIGDGTVSSLITTAGPSLQIGTASSHDLSIYTNNTTRLVVGATTGQLQHVDGSASTPSLSFINDTDTGFYRDTANQIGIALGGATAGQIAQGSYTATITGCTTSPTVTVTYQRIGNMVMMDIPTLTCTSNTSQFTLTGAPAGIRPATTTGRHNVSATQDSGTTLQSSEYDMNTSGTLTFYTGGNSSGWTAAGTKGIPVRVQLWYFII